MSYKYIIYLLIMLKYNTDFAVAPFYSKMIIFTGKEQKTCVDWSHPSGCSKEDPSCH